LPDSEEETLNMNKQRIWWSYGALGLTAGVLSSMANTLAGAPTGWPEARFGALLGGAIAVAPAFIYQEWRAGALLTCLGAAGGAVAGFVATLPTGLLRESQPQAAFFISWLVFGALVGATAGLSPAGYHPERGMRGLTGGLLAGLLCAVVHIGAVQAGRLGTVAPALASSLAGWLSGLALGWRIWNGRWWLRCLHAPTARMPREFPLYEKYDTQLAAVFSPAQYVVPGVPGIERLRPLLRPWTGSQGSRAFLLYWQGDPGHAPLVDGNAAGQGAELTDHTRIHVGQARFEVTHSGSPTVLREGEA